MAATAAVLHCAKNAAGEILDLTTDAYGTLVSLRGLSLGTITEAHGVYVVRNLETGHGRLCSSFRHAINWL